MRLVIILNELIEVAFFISEGENDLEIKRLLSRWEFLKNNLRVSWEKRFITYIDSDANDMVKFLYANKECLIVKGLLSEERYDAIIDLLDLIVRFVWDPRNRSYVCLENKERFLKEIEGIRIRLCIPRICTA